ncbi:MAG: GNAT family N-acetyltransferase [Phyllobacteriaceae bacterium]|nr:GNAT family N-acetyltransferase [Phyllobacteriaceae bacterium]
MRDYFITRAEFAVQPIEVADLREAARIHADGFGHGWTDGEIERLLLRTGTHGRVARPVGKKPVAAFMLYTLAAGEAEILTIATAAGWKRKGAAETLIKAALQHLHAERAEALFLEVGDQNDAALGLYRKLGFREVGRRNNYYGAQSAVGASALVMRRDLGQTGGLGQTGAIG